MESKSSGLLGNEPLCEGMAATYSMHPVNSSLSFFYHPGI